MKERPILFSGPMVRAILDGRKTMTRRVMKPQPEDYPYHHGLAVYRVAKKCPYGVPGDLLWVRETWATTEQAGVHPSDAQIVYRATDPDWDTMEGWRWRPSIFMPRWASRLKLRITSVSVERLREITEHDAMREGVNAEGVSTQPGIYSYRAPFAELWDDINAKRGFGWDANPWVWVVGFEQVPQ